MFSKFRIILLIITVLFFTRVLSGQNNDSFSFRIYSRFNFYSSEKRGEMILHIPASLAGNKITAEIKINGQPAGRWQGMPGKSEVRIPFDLKLSPGDYKAEALISSSKSAGRIFTAVSSLKVLRYKPNEVKIDRLTGGLIVNKKQFFPFGFYCYSPVDPAMLSDEVIKGFNMVSPYQKIIPEKLDERKAYMDRCAELGMKVHYNLLSVSGGGGVGSAMEGVSEAEKKIRLINEIKTFMDHPALLGWYISDEPNGRKVSPGQLESIYKAVKELDPWHPVSIVFQAPFLSSLRYSDALDIVMADPYPVPDLPVTIAGNVTSQLTTAFSGNKPVWMVPQAFGGGEIWSREPTFQEIRSMTWQSVIKGATGIQYFVRQGPDYFPKSASTWAECGRIATEIAELTPWILSDEESQPVETNNENIIASSRMHKGKLMIMAVNKTNEPLAATIRIKGISNGRASLIFENRSLAVSGGVIRDYLAPFGSQVYMINTVPDLQARQGSVTNLIKDPGFEELYTPGLPTACYARPGGDKGSTYFLDSREPYEGDHSLRLITPEKEKGVSIRFFPVIFKAGSTYAISLWAKSEPEQRFIKNLSGVNAVENNQKPDPQFAEIMIGKIVHARFVPEGEWKQYITFVTVRKDTLSSFKANLVLKMPGQGVAWFDKVTINEEKR